MNDDTNDIDDKGTQPYPEWRAAAIKFAADPVPYGTLLDHDWFYTIFEMEAPDSAPTVDEYKKRQLKYLSCFKKFEQWLLEEQQMALRSIYGVGYRIVLPSQQTGFAMDELHDSMGKAFYKTSQRLMFTRLDVLDTDQRRAHADAQARLAHLRNMASPKPKTGLPPYRGPS